MDEATKQKAYYLKSVTDAVYSDAAEAIRCITDLKERYSISLGFLNLSYQGYLEAKRFYFENDELGSDEFENFFRSYDLLKLQLSEVIKKEDKNTSWLSESFDNLVERQAALNESFKILN